ncbi:MAG: hypothetical protein AAB209_07620, partial [Bacteroidota bacterium]
MIEEPIIANPKSTIVNDSILSLSSVNNIFYISPNVSLLFNRLTSHNKSFLGIMTNFSILDGS